MTRQNFAPLLSFAKQGNSEISALRSPNAVGRDFRMNRTITICNDADDLAARAAEVFTQAAQSAVEMRGRFVVALAGGSTPAKTYTLLAAKERISDIAWHRVYCFFGDERMVPADDERSNFGMARKTLLAHVPVPPSNLFAVDTALPTAADAAAAYRKTLTGFFGESAEHTPPIFDLILLGLGDDGHTASLFPGMPSLAVQNEFAAASPPGVLPPPVDRVTLTYPILNAARQVVFLVSGAKKADAVHAILDEAAPPETHPAAGIAPEHGALLWMLDREAAAKTSAR